MSLPSTECPHCGARLSVVDAIAGRCPAWRGEPRPAVLRFAMQYSFVCAASAPLAVVSMLGGGTGMVDAEGRAVTGVAAEVFPLALLLALGLPGALSAYGLWNHRGWTRPFLIVWLLWSYVVFLPVMAGLVPPGELWMGAGLGAIFIPVLWLLLYREPSVVEYYAAVARYGGADTAS
jgi:hypothetical protein